MGVTSPIAPPANSTSFLPVALSLLLLVLVGSVYSGTKNRKLQQSLENYSTTLDVSKGIIQQTKADLQKIDAERAELQMKLHATEQELGNHRKIAQYRLVKQHFEKGQDLVEQNRLTEADKKFREAVEIASECSIGTVDQSSRKIEEILTEMIDKIYKKELGRQRDLIYEHLRDQSSPSCVLGVARVLLRRWCDTPDYFFEEFYRVQNCARNRELIMDLHTLISQPPPGSVSTLNGSLLALIEAAYEFHSAREQL